MFEWMLKGTPNNLRDVHSFYCKDDFNFTPISKDSREYFVSGSMTDIRDNFQSLVLYCASDVQATLNVFKHVWKKFLYR